MQGMRCSFLGITLLAGAFLASLLSCTKQESAKSIPKQDAARAVRLARTEVRPMDHVVSATGSLAAQEQSTISAKVPGRLQRLAADIGTVVRQGEVLAQIEPRDYELSLQQALATLAQARTAVGLPAEGNDDTIELEKISSVKQARAVLQEATNNRDRIRALSLAGIASESEVDTVEAAYTVALTRFEAALEDARARLASVAQRRAEYELAGKRLADVSVRAPFDGVVQRRPASIGEYVATGTPVFHLVKTDPLRLRLQVPERECPLVQAGQPVQVFVEGDTNTYSGRISRLSPALDELTRMLLVEADVPAQGSLRPGLFARANIIVSEDDKTLSVPAEALITFAGIEKVIVAQSGKAQEKVVTTGRREHGWVEVLSGLAPGESVVLNPGGLRTGQLLAPSALAESQATGQTPQ